MLQLAAVMVMHLPRWPERLRGHVVQQRRGEEGVGGGGQ